MDDQGVTDDGTAEKKDEKKKKKVGLFSKLKAGVRNLVTEPIEIPADEQTEPASGVAMSTEEFESELQALIDSHGKVLAGKMQFIDLSDTKDKYPERWAEILEPLHTLAATVIATHLTESDVYTGLEDSHVVVFARMNRAEAKQRCMKISMKISALLDERGVDSSVVTAKTVVGEIDGKAAIEELDVESSSVPKVAAKTIKPRSAR